MKVREGGGPVSRIARPLARLEADVQRAVDAVRRSPAPSRMLRLTQVVSLRTQAMTLWTNVSKAHHQAASEVVRNLKA